MNLTDDHTMETRQGNSAGGLRADGQAKVQIGNTHSHTVINNYQDSGSRLAESHLAETDKGQVRADFLRRLHTVPYIDRKDRNPKRVDGTCEWFTTHDLFRNWQQEASAMLWVSADPGCGKSVLAKYLVDEVLASSATRTTCYFFFKDDFDDQRTVESALCCILHQLFTQKPDLLLDKFLDEYREDGDQICSSFGDLWRILTEAADHYKEGEIICILDALDECVEQKRLAAGLTQLFSQGKGASKLNFLVTSRPIRDIRRGFQNLKDSQPTIHLSGDSIEEVDKIAREINLVIDRRIEELGKSQQLSMEEMRFLHQEITAISNRTYLWVHLIFPILEQDVFLSRAEMRARIHKLPRTVNEAYDRILRKSGDPDKARKVLQIIVAADRPLSLTEMAAALAFRGETHRCHRDLERDLSSPDGLRIAMRDTCGLFIVIQSSGIYLLHQTAREFLVRMAPVQRKICSSLEWEHSLDPEDSHHLLSEICIRYLLLSDFEMPKEAENSRGKDDKHQFSFLEYAASNWAHHYRQAHKKPGIDLQSLALRLCDASSSACLNWLKIYGERQLNDSKFSYELPTSLLIASYFGLDQMVNSILRGGRSSFDARGRYSERNALSWASERGHVSIVESLLKKVRRYQVFFKDMPATPTSVINRKDESGRTPLWYAVANGHLSIAGLLLRKGAKFAIQDAKGSRQNSGRSHLDARDQDGLTPLMKAARDGDSCVLELLLDGGANVNASDTDNRTALSWASSEGQDVVVKTLIDRGADIEAVASSVHRPGFTPLGLASVDGRNTTVKLLLARGANVDAKNGFGTTPLQLASNGGYVDIVKLLLDRGADINKEDIDGRTALDVALIAGRDVVVKLLLDRGADVNKEDDSGSTALHAASSAGRDVVVKLLLDRGADVNKEDDSGSTALHAASSAGRDVVVKLLLDRGADINASDSQGHTALHWASSSGVKNDVVGLLLDRGANIDGKDGKGRTALHVASKEGNIGVVELLLDRGASMNDQDDEGISAWLYASLNEHDAVAKLLLERGDLKQ
ncbi:ankyrin repeat protein [Apiospora arundinis]|uniref:Ankyrin repeat protein n=1 Tax=Apiospora arundinis TaxID=335852 RepID=A0ABR2I9Q5_9PEZI